MNSKMSIPDEERADVHNDTDLDVPDLPGDWSWGTCNHYHWNNKVNIFFGLKSAETGGYLGEIDNYIQNNTEMWTVHVRPIVDIPGEDRNRPRSETETANEYESLNEAIAAVPEHIATNYPKSMYSSGPETKEEL